MGKPSKSRNAAGARHFKATLERMRSRLNWTIIRVPFDASKAFSVHGQIGGQTRGQIRGQINVRGEINGFPFRTCLFPGRDGGHILLVNKKMQKAARAQAGMPVEFLLELDTKKRIAKTPDSLKQILAEDRSLRRWYEGLNQSTKNDIAKWISEPKSEAARSRRAEQLAERLLAVMDAERELPPILQVAFARNPPARGGWEQMSAARRRSHLFGIFYYRTPEGRMRRIEKMMEDALRMNK
jgi:uncharacterized protein YdeI (YjbR/CyaY-like superfamily)